MKIHIDFLGGSDKWKAKIIKSAEIVEDIFANEEFLKAVAGHPEYSFCEFHPGRVSLKIHFTDSVAIKVGFYSKIFTKAIAYEEGGRIFFNTRKASAGEWQNVMHEVLHAMGFKHNGNSAKGNENSVPYMVPKIAEKFTPY